MCEKGLHNCRKGWDRCNSCFAGLKGCFKFGGCGCDDGCDACGIEGATTTPVETVLPSTISPGEPEPVPPTPAKDDAPAPGPSA
jgi:hypothetical protein